MFYYCAVETGALGSEIRVKTVDISDLQVNVQVNRVL